MKALLFLLMVTSAGYFTLGCDESKMTTGSNPSNEFIITAVVPSANTLVDSSDIVACNFTWTLNVLDFQPMVYYVRFAFEGHSAGDFNYPDSLVFSQMRHIKTVTGSNFLQFPLSRIWHNPDIKHPLSTRVELIKMTSDSTFVLLNWSNIIDYQE